MSALRLLVRTFGAAALALVSALPTALAVDADFAAPRQGGRAAREFSGHTGDVPPARRLQRDAAPAKAQADIGVTDGSGAATARPVQVGKRQVAQS